MRTSTRQRRLAATAAVVAVLTLGAGCSPSPPGGGPAAPQQLDAALAGRLDTAIEAAMAAEAIPGALIGIWSPDGEYVAAFGVADTATDTPVKTDFVSRIGSVTKTFTATALLQLVENDEVDLDSPIAEYVEGVPGGEAITVRQLATMRSGLPEYTENDAFVAEVLADPGRSFTPEELLELAFSQPAAFPPGQGWRYCNTNYVLLGLLIERISGRPLPDYLAEKILAPLQLAETSLPTATRFPEPHARGYTDPPDGAGPPVDATEWSASSTWAAGGMVSTLTDMKTWVPALANGSLISPELQRERLKDASAGGLGSGLTYGIGVMTAGGWIGHNGSVPGYQTVAVYLPQRQTTLVAMINTDITRPGSDSPDTVLAKAITEVLTPDHVYAV